ncbi:MAG: DUF615 domain-containing protein [Myxococcales bacterium]|nr:DUF615 domain-containing protein [Myxococcales bacterium]
MSEPPSELSERPSRSELKRRAAEVSRLAERLAELPERDLDAIVADDEVREAIAQCRPLRKNARSRQLRLIAKLLRASDRGPIEAGLSQLEGKHRKRVRREHEQEAWRQRLLSEGDRALDELVELYPEADRNHLRTLIRSARKEPPSPRSKHASREILRSLTTIVGREG